MHAGHHTASQTGTVSHAARWRTGPDSRKPAACPRRSRRTQTRAGRDPADLVAVELLPKPRRRKENGRLGDRVPARSVSLARWEQVAEAGAVAALERGSRSQQSRVRTRTQRRDRSSRRAGPTAMASPAPRSKFFERVRSRSSPSPSLCVRTRAATRVTKPGSAKPRESAFDAKLKARVFRASNY